LTFDVSVDTTILVAVPDVPSPQTIDAQLIYLGELLQVAGLYDFALATWQQYGETLKGTPAAVA
jgi:hypothetical protein